MANLKNALKSIRQTKKRTERNMKYKGDLKTLIKKIRQAALNNDKKIAEMVKKAQQLADKMVQKKIIHRNVAARTISRLNFLKNKVK